MNKIIKSLLILCILFGCSPSEQKENIEDTIVLEEDENQIKLQVINNTNETHRFAPEYRLRLLKNTNDLSSDGSDIGDFFDMEIDSSVTITIEYNDGYLYISYSFPYSYNDDMYNLNDKHLYGKNADDYKLVRLNEKYQFTVSELNNNEITIIGQLYNVKTNETYILEIMIRRIVRLYEKS